MRVEANTHNFTHHAVRPEGRSNAVAGSFAVLAIAGAIVCIAGSFVCASAKKWGYDGNVIHNMDLYHQGFITTMTGLGVCLIAFSAAQITNR
jgi:hypothetical protein